MPVMLEVAPSHALVDPCPLPGVVLDISVSLLSWFQREVHLGLIPNRPLLGFAGLARHYHRITRAT
jgi:hypothetical protein